MADDGMMSYFAKMGLDASDFLGGINKADSGVLQFYRDVSVSMAATMLVFDKVMQYGQQFIELADQASEFVSTIDKLSVTTGMSVTELQKWSNVARYADSDITSLATSINKMQMNLADQGEAGDKVRQMLDDMGVSYKNADGSLKSSSELFPAIIQGLQGLGSSADRVTAANAIFGRSYQSLAGYMLMSKDEMRKYFDDAKVMTEGQTDALRDYEQATKDLNASTGALANTAGSELAPSMTEISQTLNDLAGNEGVKSFFSWLNDAVTLVSRGIHIMASELLAYVQIQTGNVKGGEQTMADLGEWINQKSRDDKLKAAGFKTDGSGNAVQKSETSPGSDSSLSISSAADSKNLDQAKKDADKIEQERADAITAAYRERLDIEKEIGAQEKDLSKLTQYAAEDMQDAGRDVSSARSIYKSYTRRKSEMEDTITEKAAGLDTNAAVFAGINAGKPLSQVKGTDDYTATQAQKMSVSIGNLYLNGDKSLEKYLTKIQKEGGVPTRS